MATDSDEEDEEFLLSYYYLSQKRQKTERSPRTVDINAVNVRRKELGEYHTLVRDMRTEAAMSNDLTYLSYFRMSRSLPATRMTPERFDMLLRKVRPRITRGNNHKVPISASERLAFFLRVLASGSTICAVAHSYRIGASTASVIMKEVAVALSDELVNEYMPVPSEDSWLEIADGFDRYWQLPNCIGAIDGKHVYITAPRRSGILYHCYKGGFSLVLMGVADANYTFIAIDVGAYGHQSDGGVWKRSAMGRALAEKKMRLPTDRELPGTDVVLPFVFVADAAFALNDHILRPYGGLILTHAEQIFNYRMSRGRGKINNVFGILSSPFRIFRRPIEIHPETIELLVKSAAVLHNFLRKLDGSTPDTNRRYISSAYIDRKSENGSPVLGEWREAGPVEVKKYKGHWDSLSRVSSNNASRRANGTRDFFANYFQTGKESVSWQNRMIYGENEPPEAAGFKPV